MSNDSTTRATLVGIMPELRNKIMRLVLEVANLPQEHKDGKNPATHAYKITQKVIPLAQVNRQLRRELRPRLFHGKTFSFFNTRFDTYTTFMMPRDCLAEWFDSFGGGLRYVRSMTIVTPTRNGYYDSPRYLSNGIVRHDYQLRIVIDGDDFYPQLQSEVGKALEIKHMTEVQAVEMALGGVRELIIRRFAELGRILEEQPGVIRGDMVRRFGMRVDKNVPKAEYMERPGFF
ncbi:unnamed protein product [Zymoseptoria tritici ST99CH_3D7]|uniref:Uncharacterized protein n=1 Tax=Zymoseptoria tritici (strain ST99CH_3D7) TaxID=1276538 RepID=A0A1X7RZE7_ZYMT9|nr:unnamed protein product [Zymoseptoria tritici ST99CH_3D7]